MPIMQRDLMQEVKFDVMIVTMAVMLVMIVTLKFWYLRAAVIGMRIEIITGCSCHKTGVLGVIVFFHVIVFVFSTFIMSCIIPDPDIFRLSPTLHVPSDIYGIFGPLFNQGGVPMPPSISDP